MIIILRQFMLADFWKEKMNKTAYNTGALKALSFGQTISV